MESEWHEKKWQGLCARGKKQGNLLQKQEKAGFPAKRSTRDFDAQKQQNV